MYVKAIHHVPTVPSLSLCPSLSLSIPFQLLLDSHTASSIVSCSIVLNSLQYSILNGQLWEQWCRKNLQYMTVGVDTMYIRIMVTYQQVAFYLNELHYCYSIRFLDTNINSIKVGSMHPVCSRDGKTSAVRIWESTS